MFWYDNFSPFISATNCWAETSSMVLFRGLILSSSRRCRPMLPTRWPVFLSKCSLGPADQTVTEDQLRETGIFIRQSKTGVKQIKAWSPRLRAAVALARSLPLKPGIRSLFVIHQTSGSKYTRDGFNSRWRDAKIAEQEKNPHLQVDFTFHDLKAKGVSDLEGSLEERQAISGHKNSRQTAIYDRKTKIVPVAGGQKK